MEGTRMLKLLPERILAILQDIELVADCRPADLSTPVRTILELVNALPGGRDNPEIST